MIQMGVVKASKNQSLLARETKNVHEKGNEKGKEKKNIDFKPKDKKNPLEGASGSKKDKHKNFDKAKCSYCKRGNHQENICMKKIIKQISKLLE